MKNCNQSTQYMLIDNDTAESDVVFFIDDIKASTILGIDCEGFNFGRNGILSIIQIATEKSIYIVDALSVFCSHVRIVEAIGAVLSDQSIIKIIHDGQMDADILHIICNI